MYGYGGYPLGAEYDPRAPYNRAEPQQTEYAVTVETCTDKYLDDDDDPDMMDVQIVYVTIDIYGEETESEIEEMIAEEVGKQMSGYCFYDILHYSEV